MKITSRKEAKAAGLTYYFTGKPCPKGHIDDRQTNSGTCVTCKKDWVNRNPDYGKKRYWENPEKNRAKALEYRLANGYDKTRYHEKKESEKTRAAEWRKNNKSKANAINAIRRAKRALALPIWFGEYDEFVASEAMIVAEIRSLETGIIWHVDHIIPIQSRTACGLHCADNLQVIPAAINAAKRNKMILINRYEWLKYYG